MKRGPNQLMQQPPGLFCSKRPKKLELDIPDLFDQWRGFLVRDSFTDLKVVCQDDRGSGGLSLHKAVLASVSHFMAGLLKDGRDESTLFLPDVSKKDFHNLVRCLYGDGSCERPSDGLLVLLGIKQLPPRINKSTRKSIFFTV